MTQNSTQLPVVVVLERRTTISGRREGWFAAVEDAAGRRFEFSKLDGVGGLSGEPTWYIDAVFGATGLPVEVHGFGSRACRKSAASVALAEKLDGLVAKQQEGAK